MDDSTLTNRQPDARAKITLSISEPEWRPIPDWSHYEVSEWGDIRRVKAWRTRKPGAVLAPFFRNNGYVQIVLYTNGHARRFLIHRLVAFTFLGPQPTPLHEVAHLNGNGRNNHYSNLCWMLHRENEAHKALHGTLRRGSQVGTALLDEPKVRLIKSLLQMGKSRQALAQRFGVSASTIRQISQNTTWRHVQ